MIFRRSAIHARARIRLGPHPFVRAIVFRQNITKTRSGDRDFPSAYRVGSLLEQIHPSSRRKHCTPCVQVQQDSIPFTYILRVSLTEMTNGTRSSLSNRESHLCTFRSTSRVRTQSIVHRRWAWWGDVRHTSRGGTRPVSHRIR